MAFGAHPFAAGPQEGVDDGRGAAPATPCGSARGHAGSGLRVLATDVSGMRLQGRLILQAAAGSTRADSAVSGELSDLVENPLGLRNQTGLDATCSLRNACQ